MATLWELSDLKYRYSTIQRFLIAYSDAYLRSQILTGRVKNRKNSYKKHARVAYTDQHGQLSWVCSGPPARAQIRERPGRRIYSRGEPRPRGSKLSAI